MKQYYTIQFAAAYGEGTYNSGAYACASANGPECTTAAVPAGGSTTNGSGGAGGALADTGVMVLAFATMASLIIFAALIVRIWRRKPALVPVPVDDSRTQETSAPRITE